MGYGRQLSCLPSQGNRPAAGYRRDRVSAARPVPLGRAAVLKVRASFGRRINRNNYGIT